MKIKDEIWCIFFGGRYLILLMGAFSIYTGIIYNDFFSKSANLFGSSWYPAYDKRTISSSAFLQLEPRTSENITDQMYAGQPYPFGIDPIWQISNNKIPFMNSLKMKFSIILAVFHMGFGIVLSFLNDKSVQICDEIIYLFFQVLQRDIDDLVCGFASTAVFPLDFRLSGDSHILQMGSLYRR